MHVNKVRLKGLTQININLLHPDTSDCVWVYSHGSLHVVSGIVLIFLSGELEGTLEFIDFVNDLISGSRNSLEVYFVVRFRRACFLRRMLCSRSFYFVALGFIFRVSKDKASARSAFRKSVSVSRVSLNRLRLTFL